MNDATIIGAIIGLPVGGVVGLLNPALLDSVYPKEWKKSYENNGAILFPTCIGGIVGGTIGGAIGGSMSNNGVIGGIAGGAIGGTLGASIYIYTFFLDYQKTNAERQL